MKNYKNIIRILLKNGADPNYVTDNCDSFLHQAIQYSDIDVFKYIWNKWQILVLQIRIN
jgi:hypothetical protein